MSMSITLNGMFESVTLVLLVNCHLVCLIRETLGVNTLSGCSVVITFCGNTSGEEWMI